ncbi:hypothetical protein ACSNOI_00480 [Actinomadura kijaniata]|uniref:hypothetical protein n=1 Tax=Actinomadura kijaniata TaxID=46161 RepID=UPI003F1B168B
MPELMYLAVKKGLASEIWNVEDKDRPLKAVTRFRADYCAGFPKVADGWDGLSAFVTVRHRIRGITRSGPRTAGLAMVFKLIESARTRRRAVHGKRDEVTAA